MLRFFEYLFLILGIVFGAYVVSGLRTEQGWGAVTNFCAPVNWMGNVSVSMSAVIDERTEAFTQKSFQEMHYDCEYIGWRLFFEQKYVQWKKQQKLLREAGGDTARADTSVTARYHDSGTDNPVTGGEDIINQGAPK
jgi:hypothetical protein